MGCINTVFRDLSYTMHDAYAVCCLCLCICAYVTQKVCVRMCKRVCLCAPMSLDVCAGSNQDKACPFGP